MYIGFYKGDLQKQDKIKEPVTLWNFMGRGMDICPCVFLIIREN